MLQPYDSKGERSGIMALIVPGSADFDMLKELQAGAPSASPKNAKALLGRL